MTDALTINEQVRKITHYTGTSEITDDEVSYTYIPTAALELGEVLSGIKTIDTGTDNTNATTGDLFDDRIIAHLAADLMDKAFETMRFNPITNEEVQRHRVIADELIMRRYAIHIGRGRTMLPRPMKNAHPTTAVSRTDTDDFD